MKHRAICLYVGFCMLSLCIILFASCGGGGGGPTTPEVDNGPFAGTWKLEFVGQFPDGSPAYTTITFNLAQKNNENTINGTRVGTCTDRVCCTASYTVSVAGIVSDETIAVLSWADGTGRCDGSDGCWITTSTDGGTFRYQLVENGTKLVSGSAEYIRQ
jgi:hypothetical protein